MRFVSLPTFVCLSTLLTLAACSKDDSADGELLGSDGSGSGFGEEGEDDWGGDGDPSTGGDGDGDTTGGDPGDGDTGDEPPAETGDGDGDGDGDPEPACNDVDDVVLYLSPDDSNSMSAPVQVRERVLAVGSTSLAGVPIRTWEFMNYYGFPYPAADDGTLGLHAAIQPVEAAESTWRLQLAVASEIMTPDERPPMNVTLVLDTSGSMGGEPIALLKETSRAIAASLRAGDKVSVVEWDTTNTWSLGGYAVTGPNDATLLGVIDAIEANGGTNLNGGLVSGYQLAQQVYDAAAINRLVLISDGGANAGITDIDLIAQNAAFGGSDGIYLVGVGVGDSGYNDDLMNDVTDAGKGASVFIADNLEAWTRFNADFENTMAIAARNVQVELTLPPGFEIVKFSGEEYSGDPKEVEPQHIAPNDAMVFHQQIQTCAPELMTDDTPITVKATWEDPWSFATQELEQTWTYAELADMDQTLLLKGAAVLAYAESLQAYKLAYTNDEKAAALAPAFEALMAAQAVIPGDEDLGEIAAVLAALEG